MEAWLASMPVWLVKFCDDFYMSFIYDQRYKYIISGLGNTLLITVLALLIGLLIGILLALVRVSWDQNGRAMSFGPGKAALWLLNLVSKIYLTVIRGTPVVVQIMILYFIIMAASKNKLLVAVISFGINSGAYVAEIIRSGIMSVDKGQFEAGRSLGFGYGPTMWLIILPQAFKTVLPTLVNEFIVLLKETSVAGYVSIQDLTRAGNIIRGISYKDLPLWGVAVIYLVIVMFFTWIMGKLERRLRGNER